MDVTAPRKVRRHDTSRESIVAAVDTGFWVRSFLAVLFRPALWSPGVRVLVRATPPGWWRRWPFVPRPDPAFLRFRFETAYGFTGVPQVGDFLAYLRWVRERG